MPKKTPLFCIGIIFGCTMRNTCVIENKQSESLLNVVHKANPAQTDAITVGELQ